MAAISASLLVISVILCTIVLGTIIGNIFVIMAIIIDKNLQTNANQLVLSLAMADLMVACLVMPLGAYNDLRQGWYLGTLACEFWTSADVLCCTASILNLLAIALDRFWAVTNVDYIYRRTRRRVNMMILCAWTVGAIVSLAPIFGWKDPDFSKRVMTEHKCLVSQDVAYQIFATISTFYAPLVLLLALYWRIFQVARKRIRRKPSAHPSKLVGAAPSQPAGRLVTDEFAPGSGPEVAPVAELDCGRLEWAAPGGPCCARCCACKGRRSPARALSAQINHRAKVTTMVSAYLRSSPTIGRQPGQRDKGDQCCPAGSASGRQPTQTHWAGSALGRENIDENLSGRPAAHVGGISRHSAGYGCHLSPISKPMGPTAATGCDCSQPAARALSMQALSSDSFSSSCSSIGSISASGRPPNRRLDAESASSASCLPCASASSRLSSSALSALSSSPRSSSSSSPSTSLRVAGKPGGSEPSQASACLLVSSRQPTQYQDGQRREYQCADDQPAGQSQPDGEEPARPLDLRARFRALGRLVSFVQTSRQLASSLDSSASPTSSNVQPNSPGAALARAEPGTSPSARSLVCLDRQEPKEELSGAAATCPHPTAAQKSRPCINSVTTNNLQQMRANLEIRREKKAAKTLAIITGVFVCCWLPFFLNAIVMPICGQSCTPSDLVLSVLLWLGYLNSLLNPIIYTIFSPDFRRAFRRLLCWPSLVGCFATRTGPSSNELPSVAVCK